MAIDRPLRSGADDVVDRRGRTLPGRHGSPAGLRARRRGVLHGRAAGRRPARGGARRPGTGRGGQRRRGRPRARRLGRARETVGGATRRERQHVEALSALVARRDGARPRPGRRARGASSLATRCSSTRPAAPSASPAGPIASSSAMDVPGAPGPRVRRRLVVSVGAGLHVPRDRSLRGVPAAVGALAAAVPGQRRAPATTSLTSTSRRSTRTPAPRSWPTGWPATTRAPRFTATWPGTWRCSSCTAAATRRRWRSSSATSWRPSIRAWP